jgi:hypothetical protein
VLSHTRTRAANNSHYSSHHGRGGDPLSPSVSDFCFLQKQKEQVTRDHRYMVKQDDPATPGIVIAHNNSNQHLTHNARLPR